MAPSPSPLRLTFEAPPADVSRLKAPTVHQRETHLVERLLQPAPMHALTKTVLLDGQLFAICLTCSWTKELFDGDHAPAVCGVEMAMRDWRQRCIKDFERNVGRVIDAGTREGENFAARLRELAG